MLNPVKKRCLRLSLPFWRANHIRTAVSLGGDCDTLTVIAGSIAEGFYGVPAHLKLECWRGGPKQLVDVLQQFEERIYNE